MSWARIDHNNSCSSLDSTHICTPLSLLEILIKWIRGRPLIIWGGVVQIEKKNCSEVRRKKKNEHRVPKKKKY